MKKQMKDIRLNSIEMDKWDHFLQSSFPKPCNAVEIYAHESDDFSIGLLNSEIDSYELSKTSALCLRADCHQIGYAYSEATSENPTDLLKSAIDNASFVENDDAQYQRFYKGNDHYIDLNSMDERLNSISADQKIEYAFQLEALALSQNTAIQRLSSCSISTSINRKHIHNSLGLHVASESGIVIAYCSPIAEKNSQIKNGFAYDIAYAIEDLDLEKIARNASEDVMAQFDAHSIPSGHYPIILKNEACISLLSAFFSIFNADSAQKGLSLLAGKEGKSIAASCVDIIDDPLYEKALNQYSFDDEGVASLQSIIIEEGIFKTFLHNRKTAQKAATNTTGNANKHGVGGVLGIGPSNFYLREGNKSEKQLLKEMHSGVYITGFSGLHSGCNSVSGSFSLLAKGFLIENGLRKHPIDQITASGSIFDLLTSIIDVGNDTKFNSGSIITPSIFIESLQIAGK